MTDARAEIYADITRERERQEEKFGPQGSAANRSMSNPDRLAILAEEFGEVAHEVTELILVRRKHRGEPEVLRIVEGHRRRDLEKELVEVASVCVAWIEGLRAVEIFEEVGP